MARAADQFRSSDVTFWGLVALGCWGLAMVLGGVGLLLPQGMLAGLHTSRLKGADLHQLREQVAQLASSTAESRREAAQLARRIDLQQQAQTEVATRVGALEVSVPTLTERAPQTTAIDRSPTASITDVPVVSYEADGGSVRIAQRPLIVAPGSPGMAPEPEQTSIADGTRYGVSLGFPIAGEDGGLQWQVMMSRVGTLLVGLTPLLAPVEGSDGVVLVAGPLASDVQAANLCEALRGQGIPCSPTPFSGDALPLLN